MSIDNGDVNNWSGTKRVIARIQGSENFINPDEEAENGYFQGRRIIGRDTAIVGGVYLGSGSREAIVVDEKYGELTKAYDKLQENLAQGLKEENILSQVYNFVCNTMPYSPKAVERVRKDYDLIADQKVSLDLYIHYHGGYCRHQALLTGYLLEKLTKDNFLGGRVSIDRNYNEAGKGHAWVRYTDANGEIYIVDPAQSFVGKEKDKKITGWNYKRPMSNS